MIPQRVTPALRQLARQSFPVSRNITPTIVGRRLESTAGDAAGKNKAKLVFRFGPKDVPVELWPMGAVVIAGIIGAGFAISRHFYKDEDVSGGLTPLCLFTGTEGFISAPPTQERACAQVNKYIRASMN
ncbi:hypothetical protein FS749_006158 [Ceratobasidium sp. UAMH 11750]|nr:hypothetical protein FS749_006158 [Ceratobasidium sp. UAMH 11750]